MKSFSTMFITLLISCNTLANNNIRMADIRSAGLGGNEVTQSVHFNPSLLSLYRNRSISLNYYNMYGIKELGTFSFLGMIPNEVLPIGIHVSSFGYEEYRHTMFRLLMSKQLHEYWMIGAAIQYSYLNTVLIEESVTGLSIDVGINWSPVDNLLVGLLIMNYPSVLLKSESIYIKDFTAYKMQMGFEWLVLNDLLIFLTLENNKEYPVTGSMGIEYLIEERFRIRAGLKVAPLSPSLGIGYVFSSFSIDVVALYHAVLGISSGIGIIYSF